MDLPRYLARIDSPEPARPDGDTLRRLHRAHMLAVPFENLDIVPLHRPIRLDEDALWEKLVLGGRGGFCYELNGLFAALLKEIGFKVIHLNARVFNEAGELGIQFDHLALLVEIPDQAARWLADVGFGDSFVEPLRFEPGAVQEQDGRAYRLEETGGGYQVAQRDYDGRWSRLYFFDLQPRRFPEDYQSACLYHQTSPKSSFTRGSIISRATPEGRVSLEDGWLIVTSRGKRQKRPLGDGEYPRLLKEHFQISLDR